MLGTKSSIFSAFTFCVCTTLPVISSNRIDSITLDDWILKRLFCIGFGEMLMAREEEGISGTDTGTFISNHSQYSESQYQPQTSTVKFPVSGKLY